MNTAVMFSSATDLWATPQWLFDDFNAEFGFTLDACALPSNAKCAKYFTPEVDGLAQDWGGEVVWCNPPYGREIGKWVKKCAEESKKKQHNSRGTTASAHRYTVVSRVYLPQGRGGVLARATEIRRR